MTNDEYKLFSGTDLRQAGNHFNRTKFGHLDLAGAVLSDITFSECLFENCRLSGSRFKGCNFQDCHFKDCDLSMVRLGGSVLLRVQFAGCKLTGIDWSEARQSILKVGFDRCILNSGTFAGMDVSGTRFIGCVARDVDFREADLSGTVFQKTDLAESLFLHTDLTGADLSEARSYAIDPTDNTIKKTVFSLPEGVGLLAKFDIVWRQTPQTMASAGL